jgi:virginiamycin A acetyltransferase
LKKKLEGYVTFTGGAILEGMHLKRAAKSAAQAVSLAAAFFPAAASGFGSWHAVYTLFAHVFSLAPGLPGDYLRIAFYRHTLTKCALSSRVSFGSFFAYSEAHVGEQVYIGPYCVLGHAEIGAHTQIAAGVQILSGRRQHARNGSGALTGSEQGEFTTVRIGANCWIGAGAIVMADVGEGSTIGAGAVVTREIPPGSTATGVPARVHGEG